VCSVQSEYQAYQCVTDVCVLSGYDNFSFIESSAHMRGALVEVFPGIAAVPEVAEGRVLLEQEEPQDPESGVLQKVKVCVCVCVCWGGGKGEGECRCPFVLVASRVTVPPGPSAFRSLGVTLPPHTQL
jgi:hypothetical protein